MSRPARSRVLASATAAALAASVTGLVLLVGCDRNVPTRPIADAGGTGGSAVVAGTIAANGRGVADAIVTLEPIVGGRTATVARLLRAAGSGDASTTGRRPLPAAGDLRVVTTDGGGRYAFSGVAPGEYVVTAKGSHHLGGSKPATVASAAAVETTFVNIALTPTGTYTGSFWLENRTDHSGIVAYVAGTSNVAVADDAGRFELRDVPIGSHTVTASYPGFLDASLSGALAAAGDSVELGGIQLMRDRNIPPTATAASGGSCYTGITLAGSGDDPDGSIAIYEWDYEDDGEIDYYSTTTGVTNVPLDPGTYQARFTVTDDKGAIASAVVQFFVSPPDTIYVSSTTGGPGNPGTRQAPVSTIAEGIALALAADCEPLLLVATGFYNESPVFVSGTRYFGGYDPATWTKSPGERSIVNVGTTPASIEPFAFGVTVNAFEFRADLPATPGASSIAFRAVQVGPAALLQDCVFQASRGAQGADGIGGAVGGTGGPAPFSTRRGPACR